MEPWIIALLLGFGLPAAAAASAVVMRFKLWRSLKRVIRTTPLRKAADVSATRSRVAVQGRARARETLQAPLSVQPCIGFRLNISFRSPPSEGSEVHQAVELSRMEAFDLVDDSGSVAVRGAPVLLLGAPRAFDAATLSVALTDETLQRLLSQQGYSVTDIVVGRGLHVVERVLLDGATAYVNGALCTQVAADGVTAGYRQLPTCTVLEPPQGEALVVADVFRDQLLAEFKVRT